jgi:hypothetical protein
MENWKQITVGVATFEVSDRGQVRTEPRTQIYKRSRDGREQVVTRTLPGKLIKAQHHHTGYAEIGFRIDRKRTRILIHRAVAMAFVPGYENGLVVNHINGIKTDNRSENLEWVSMARNTQHAWETGLVDLHGENQPTHKLTSKRVTYIRKLLNQGISAHTLAIVAGVSPSTIEFIRSGKRWASLENSPFDEPN